MDSHARWLILVNRGGMCSYNYKIIEVEKKVREGHRLTLGYTGPYSKTANIKCSRCIPSSRFEMLTAEGYKGKKHNICRNR